MILSRAVASKGALSYFQRRLLMACCANSRTVMTPVSSNLGMGASSALLPQRAFRPLVTVTRPLGMPVETTDVPTMGDSITEGTIVDIPVAPGDFVNVDDVVVVLETDKVSVDVRAKHAGALVEVLGEIDTVVEVGSPLFRIDTDADAPEIVNVIPPKAEEDALTGADQKTQAAAPPPPPSPPVAPVIPLPTAPAPKAAPSKPPKPSSPEPPSIQTMLGARSERRTKMSRMRQRVAERMKEAQNTAAMLTTFQECDMSALMELRKVHQDEFTAKHGIKLGFMSAFVKAATGALQELPIVNAYIDGTEIVYRDYVDISVAVASPTGLVVPVLRNTSAMGFADVERNIALYAQKAKDGTLSLDDMAGGTFTISNGGVFGSMMGTPILNPPQSAILGMHATKLRPVVVKGEIKIRPVMYLALTYDHRLIDGREGVTFLKSIAEKISDPTKLLLEI